MKRRLPNQTFKHEVNGGYMWSPKRGKPNKKTGNTARIQFYENMKEVAPGDIVFSFNNTFIACIGIVTSYCFESPRPLEFGNAGNQWENEGWKVLVDYKKMISPIKPVDHIRTLIPLLPSKYSPLKTDGKGNQVYLSKLSQAMATTLVHLIGQPAKEIANFAAAMRPTDLEPSEAAESLDKREKEIEGNITNDPRIPDTEKDALIKARKGQGLFRKRLCKIEKQCRLTGVENPSHLIASHIKPWRKSHNRERLDGENGLLLAPHIDHLFDKGFISFAADGKLLISPIADQTSLKQMGIPISDIYMSGKFSSGQQVYLQFHRTEIYKKANSK